MSISEESITFEGDIVNLDPFKIEMQKDNWYGLDIGGNYWGHGKLVVDLPDVRTVLVLAKGEDIFIPAHMHDCHEQILVLRGSLELGFSGRTRKYEQHECISVLPRIPRQEFSPKESLLQFTWTR